MFRQHPFHERYSGKHGLQGSAQETYNQVLVGGNTMPISRTYRDKLKAVVEQRLIKR